MSPRAGGDQTRRYEALCAHYAMTPTVERGRRRIEHHLDEARLLSDKKLDTFDFNATPMVSKAQATALAAGDAWLKIGANLLLFDVPGGGKTHVAAAIGLGLVENGWRVLFTRTTDIVQKLQAARRDPDQAMTLAVDRLVHHATIFEMNVDSYRRRSAVESVKGPGRPPSRATFRSSADRCGATITLARPVAPLHRGRSHPDRRWLYSDRRDTCGFV